MDRSTNISGNLWRFSTPAILTLLAGALAVTAPAKSLHAQAWDQTDARSPATLPQNRGVVLNQLAGPLDPERFLPLRIDRLANQPSAGRLATEDSIRAGLVLQATGRGAARMDVPAPRASQYWTTLPVDFGIVRIQRVSRGSLWSLAATGPAGAAILAPTARDAEQLWRVVSYGDTARLDSVAYPGRSLAGSADGLVMIERTSGAEAQRWFIDFGPPPPTILLPTVRLASHKVLPNPPLPPALVTLANSHDSDLRLVIGDLRPGQASRQVSVPAGGSVQARLARDAGATIRETYEVHSPTGLIAREEYVTTIPPTTLYDISVYEQFLQSIAIDRTGKSPHPIEDINYQPKSVGIFPIPPGEQLPERARIDVWRQAKAADNPGGVRPLQRDEPTDKRIGPLERALEEATRE